MSVHKYEKKELTQIFKITYATIYRWIGEKQAEEFKLSINKIAAANTIAFNQRYKENTPVPFFTPEELTLDQFNASLKWAYHELTLLEYNSIECEELNLAIRQIASAYIRILEEPNANPMPMD